MGSRRRRYTFWTAFKPSGEAVGQSLAEPFQALPKACPRPRQLAGLLRPLCGLSEACLLSRQLAGLLRPLCGLSEACLLSSYGHPKATLGILDRLQTLFGSRQACCGLSVARHFGPPSNPRVKQLAKPSRTLPSTSKGLSEASPAGRPAAASLWPVRGLPPLSAAGRPVAASLWPVRSLPPLFLWASEGDVRHFGPPSNPPRQPAGLLRPLCGQAFWTAFKPSSAAGRPVAASLWPVRSLPPLLLWASAFWTAFKPSSAAGRPVAASLWPVRSLPPLFLWASEGDVRHFGPPSNPPRRPAGLLRPLCGLSEACLLSS